MKVSPLHPKWGPAVPTCPRCFGSEITFDKVRTPFPAHPSPLQCACLLPPFETHCSHMLFCVWQVRILVVSMTTGTATYLQAQIFLNFCRAVSVFCALEVVACCFAACVFRPYLPLVASGAILALFGHPNFHFCIHITILSSIFVIYVLVGVCLQKIC